MNPESEEKLTKLMGRVEEVLDKHVVYKDKCSEHRNYIRSEIKTNMGIIALLFGILMGVLKWLG